ncbi:arginine deiminase family protein [Flavobacteriaceae bacterium]|nr:arginine deiminase family protein [Flavobacteriaceae bacterium]MDC0622972.1 arginine deiminase family protein [Flavobacteriaceae bacterium]
MLKININNETSELVSVILGSAISNGPTPNIEDCYDPKSIEHILNGTYPIEKDMINELNSFENILVKYGVKVYRPDQINNYNQIFTRDISFVIEDKIVLSNMIDNRSSELSAINYILSEIPSKNIIKLSSDSHVEGGDVILFNDYVFIGVYSGEDYPNYITARTNLNAVNEIKVNFPNKSIKTFELRKSNTSPKDNALHLDCCFQPIGTNKAIIHPGGFLIKDEYEWLVDFFGKDNIFETTKEEMYNMSCNVFSISENVIVSENNFDRLNEWLTSNGFKVEKISYSEIAKQEGLLRCSTMPLIRK